MIPQAFVTHWSSRAPWPNEAQIEQDLILSRLIEEVGNHDLLRGELSMRGGTCLHKLHLPAPLRYSEDLDYVRRTDGPVGPLMDAIREVAIGAGLTEHNRSQKEQMVHMVFDAEPTSGFGRIRIKVETNVREIQSFEARVTRPYEVASSWWAGTAVVPTPADSIPARAGLGNRSARSGRSGERSGAEGERYRFLQPAQPLEWCCL